jgi:acyl-CoA synthetase (AMP-forming)/AMP-acid ligase II
LSGQALQRNRIEIIDKQNRQQQQTIVVHSSGRIAPFTSVAIVRPDSNQVCPYGEAGEIWVASPANVDSFMSNQLIAGGVMNKRIASFQGISEELKQLDFARTCDSSKGSVCRRK